MIEVDGLSKEEQDTLPARVQEIIGSKLPK